MAVLNVALDPHVGIAVAAAETFAQREAEALLETVVPMLGEMPKDAAGQKSLIEKLRADMFAAAKLKEFERAAELRDLIKRIEETLLQV